MANNPKHLVDIDPTVLEEFAHQLHILCTGVLNDTGIERDTAIWADLDRTQRSDYTSLGEVLLREVIKYRLAVRP